MAKRKPTVKRAAKPRTAEQYFAQPARRQESQKRAAHVLSDMRTWGASLTQASREHSISPATVRRYAGSALRKTPRGKYAARARDTLPRVLLLPTNRGLAEIATKDSRTASLLGEYWNATNTYLETGDDSALARFTGLTVTDAQGNAVPLLTDTAELERLGSAGVLSFQSLYARSR
jgi:hypothetical protein